MLREVVLLLLSLAILALADYSLEGVEEEEMCLLQASLKLVRPDHEGLASAVDASNARHNTVKQRRAEKNASASFPGAQQGEDATLKRSEPSRSFVYFACSLVGYAALALVYDQRTGPREGDKQRVLEWDSVKLFVQVMIVAQHIHLYLGFDQDDFKPFEANRFVMGGLHPDQAASSFAHLGSFEEWLVFDYDGAFRMPAFAFISGVFGQKVEMITLLRVACYTYGTFFMCYLLSEFYYLTTLGQVPRGGGVGVLWYLVCLFWWRVTLSPVFDTLKNQFLMLRLSVYVLITTWYFVCFDLFGQSTDVASQATWLIPNHSSGLLPDSSYFSLAPFFACGLIIPSRQWTELLRNKSLQIAACFAMVLLCVGVTNSAYKAWLSGHMLTLPTHWPLSPDLSQALDASRMCCHFGWLLYKGFTTWAALWSVAALTSLLQALAPALTQRLLNAGERTMYSYVLHMHFLNMAADLCNARSILNQMTSLQFCFAVYASALFLVLILTSRLTEKCLHPVVMPFWLLDVFAFFGVKAENVSSRKASS
eukprot:TRINITY_DN8752_c0_g6_i1.p1 TRINITY_DN8752_c0_g6~~TRINITY_DN8752_c0_g6_i1.p1  ORF type:complete len:537 (+),score=62.03 TRINITY_DN8752_c0_g6_i1:86-1696(+)